MFNILVVDDEIIAVAGIRKLLQKYRYPLKVYEAYDGEEAKQIIEQVPIHILLTDIELPLIDGLKLIEIAKKMQPRIKTIVFSAYSNFEYARKAISLNAMQYLLKPIEVDEFRRVISNCIALCQNEFGANEDDLIVRDIFKNNTLDDKIIENISFFRWDNAEGSLYALCYLRFNEKILTASELNSFIAEFVHIPSRVFNVDSEECLLSFYYRREHQIDCHEVYLRLIEWLKGRTDKGRVFFVSAERMSSPAALSSQIKKMLHLKELYFYFNEESTYLDANSAVQTFIPTINTQVVLDDIYKSIEGKNYWSFRANVSRLLEILELNKQLSPMYVKYIFFDIVRKLQQSIPEIPKNKIGELLENISKTDNIKEIGTEMQPLIAWLLEHNDSQSTYNHGVVEQLLNYIHDNYNTDIPLETLSELVSFSPAYTSTIFKQITGRTITAYINDYRMRMAKKLLRETNKKLGEIYPMVGYSSMTYFCVLFKDMFGETPSQYRKKKRKGEATK